MAQHFLGAGRTVVKRTAERILVGSGMTRVARAIRARHGVVLAYHNIVPDGFRITGDRSLHLPRSRFAEQLDRLARDYDIVPLHEVMNGHDREDRPGTRPRVSITFDDAYRGAVTIGVDELARRELPATIFVAPVLLGRDSFWWDAFAGPDGVIPPEFLRIALEACYGAEESVRYRANALGMRPRRIGGAAAPATEAELRDAMGRARIACASHSWSHTNLAVLSGAKLHDELLLPFAWLKARFETVVPWLSYPYGLVPEHVRAIADAGYEAAVRVNGGPLTGPSADRYRLPRVNIPAGISPDGFRLRVSGMVSRA